MTSQGSPVTRTTYRIVRVNSAASYPALYMSPTCPTEAEIIKAAFDNGLEVTTVVCAPLGFRGGGHFYGVEKVVYRDELEPYRHTAYGSYTAAGILSVESVATVDEHWQPTTLIPVTGPGYHS